MQFRFHHQQLVAFTLHELGHRNTRGTGHHLGNFLRADLGAQQLGDCGLAAFCPLGFAGFQILRFLEVLLQRGQLAVLQFGHLGQIALAGERLNLLAQAVHLLADLGAALRGSLLSFPDFIQIGDFFLQAGDFFLNQLKPFLRGLILFALDGFAFDLQLDQAAIQLVHHLGLGVQLDFDFGRRLVNQVNCLIRQKTVGNVAVAQLGRRDDSRVGDIHAVVYLVAFFQAAQDRHSGFYRGLAHHNFLEAALQRGILLDVFAVLVQRSRTHAMQLATGQRRLEHIACIHRAFGLARADHGVQLVDEHNGLTLVFGQVFEHVFQALFELAAKFCAG